MVTPLPSIEIVWPIQRRRKTGDSRSGRVSIAMPRKRDRPFTRAVSLQSLREPVR